MVLAAYNFGTTPVEILENLVPETYQVTVAGKAAEICNKVLFNVEDSNFISILDKASLLKLLNNLKGVALDTTKYWSYEEVGEAKILRSNILLTLGIEEL